MFNDELADVFLELADMEEIEGQKWESIAYRRVAISIAGLGEDIREISRRNELRKIDGVGEAIEKKIQQYIEEGKIIVHDNLKKKYPVDFIQLRKIQGLGAKKIASLYVNLGITGVSELRAAIESHKISKLPGFGEKTEMNLSKALEISLSAGPTRIPLGKAYRDITELRDFLDASGLFDKVVVAGSTRRMKETIGDVDILAIARDKTKAADVLVQSDRVSGIVVRGDLKITVNLKLGITCDLRFIEEGSFGAALQYFTGSKEHNIHLRNIAISSGMKLNEYGLFRGESQVAGKTEAEIYSGLGMEYIEPELRENTGEIEASLRHALPDVIGYEQVRGDTHAHTVDSDGSNTVEEMLLQARKNGLEYIVFTNHSKNLRVANGLDEAGFRDLNRRIDEASSRLNFPALKGVELEILKDGSLDLGEAALSEMDFVLASLHQFVTGDSDENTGRVVKAIQSGLINGIAHPTGRLIGKRESYKLDMERIIAECSTEGVCLEINGDPFRSDLPADLVRRASSTGVKFTLGSDAHNVADLSNLRFATAIARRGWLGKEQVINTLTIENFRKVMSR
ncbi:MAG: DNA polymerase/3'-5' exonuclease PolX [Thermoplasmataceae archaeon]